MLCMLNTVKLEIKIKKKLHIYMVLHKRESKYGISFRNIKMLTVMISPAYIASGSFFFSPVNITVNQAISL